MNLEEFRLIEKKYRTLKPKIFALFEPDPAVNSSEINKVEAVTGLNLPIGYRNFVLNFGGGSYAFVHVFSLCPSSEFYLPIKVAEARSYGLPDDVIPFFDDYSGGYYCFQKNEERVSYWNQLDGVNHTEYEDLFSFLARYAFEPA